MVDFLIKLLAYIIVFLMTIGLIGFIIMCIRSIWNATKSIVKRNPDEVPTHHIDIHIEIDHQKD